MVIKGGREKERKVGKKEGRKEGRKEEGKKKERGVTRKAGEAGNAFKRYGNIFIIRIRMRTRTHIRHNTQSNCTL